MAFSAAVDPIFSKEMRQVITTETVTERRGICILGSTYSEGISRDSASLWERLTVANQPENGSPLSRANDHSCREAVASTLIALNTIVMIIIDTMTSVAA